MATVSLNIPSNQDIITTAQRRQKTMYDKRLHGDPFNVGDKVWLYSCNSCPKR